MAEYTTADSTICKVVIQKQYGTNQTTENVLHFAKTGLGADMNTLSAAISTWLTTQFATLLSNDVFLTQFMVENVLTGAQVIQDMARLPGGRTGPHAPGALAIVVSLRSGTKFRYRNGRMFLDGFPISWVGGDTYVNPAPAIIAPFVADFGPRFMAITPSSGWNIVVYTKGKVSAPPAPLDWPRGAIDVKSIRFNQVFGTQRRRIPGHGS